MLSVLIMLAGVNNGNGTVYLFNVRGYCYTCFIEPIGVKMLVSFFICFATASLVANAILLNLWLENKPPF
jgi:hypothetical protein